MPFADNLMPVNHQYPYAATIGPKAVVAAIIDSKVAYTVDAAPGPIKPKNLETKPASKGSMRKAGNNK